MRLGIKPKQAQETVNIATQPGYVAAARVAPATGGKLRLRQAVVLSLQDSAADKLDAVSSELRLNRADIRLLLDAGDYQFMQTELPAVEEAELKVALKWQIKDLLRFPVDQSTLDVITTPTENLGAMRRPSGYAIVAPNELVLDRMLRVRSTRSRLSVIDIPESAQRNIATQLEEPGRATAVLSITQNGCLYTVSRGGALFFTRNFDVSLAALDASPEARRTLFDRLLLELQRSMDVLDRQFSFLSVSALWLAPFEHRDELLLLLIEALDQPVKAIELQEVFDCDEGVLPASANEQAALMFPLGLALHQTIGPGQNINLVDVSLIPVEPVFPLQRQVQALGVIAAVLGLIIWFAHGQVKQLEIEAAASKKRVDAVQQRVATLVTAAGARQPDPLVARKLENVEQEAKALLQVAKLLESGGIAGSSKGYSPHLYGLARETVPGVWLTGFSFHEGKVELQGMTLHAETIPVYLQALKRIQPLQGQSFDVFQAQRQEATTGSANEAARPAATAFSLSSREETATATATGDGR